jgi:hypothetical protein
LSHLIEGDHKEGEEEDTPEGGNNGDESSKMGDRIDITITHSGHGDDHLPESIPHVIIVMSSALKPPLLLKLSNSKTKHEDGDEESNTNPDEGLAVEVGFDGKSRTWSESIHLAHSIGSLIGPMCVMFEESKQNVDTEKHDDSDIVIKTECENSSKLLIRDVHIKIGRSVYDIEDDLNEECFEEIRSEERGTMVHESSSFQHVKFDFIMSVDKECTEDTQNAIEASHDGNIRVRNIIVILVYGIRIECNTNTSHLADEVNGVIPFER